jgi:Arc/MetJ-type ribon-helix-helix transcriptional regulator
MTVHYEKITVSLPARAAEAARQAVRSGKATSVSAYVAAAIEEKAKTEDLGALLDEMLEATGGPMTPAERRATDRLLGIKPKRKRATSPSTRQSRRRAR